MFERSLISPQTASQMVEAYDRAAVMLEQAYQILYDADALLRATFGEYGIEVFDKPTPKYTPIQETIDKLMLNIRRTAWKRILERIEVHKFVNEKRKDKIEESLEKDVPELTVAIIFDLLESFVQNAKDFQMEVLNDAFDYLRPHGIYYPTFKTNSEYEIGPKVILAEKVERGYSSRFRVRSGSADRIIAIDKAFHILDGKGIPDGYKSPLVDAIGTTETGDGNTEYFYFKCYRNGNLHLTFLRPDLVRELNAIAGGMRLRNGEKRKQGKLF